MKSTLYALFQWATESVPVAPVPMQPAYGEGTPAPAPAPAATEDWSATDTGDWSSPAPPTAAQTTPAAPAPAAPAPAAGNEWGGSGAENWG